MGATAAYAAEGTREPTTEARNKAVAARVFDEIFNQGKFQVAEEIYAPDFVNHGLDHDADLKVDQDAVHEEKRAFPNLEMTVVSMVAEGDLVTVLWILRGTHLAAGYGLPFPTGVRIELRGITIWRIVDGKIREEWTAFDMLPSVLRVGERLALVVVGLLSLAGVLWWTASKAIRLRRALPT
jgi:steroid delta-isomerase-like uncharacterized protein